MKRVKVAMIGVGNISGIYLKNITQTFRELEELRKKASVYLDSLLVKLSQRKGALADFANLFLVAAFIERNREDI